MKNLKLTIKQKLLISNASQLIFILLLIFFIFNVNKKLSNLLEEKVAINHNITQLREITFGVKDYVNNKNEFTDIQQLYLQSLSNDTSTTLIGTLKSIWSIVEKIETLRIKNADIEKEVLAFADLSMQQSNNYIQQVSEKLANPSQQNQVTTLERLVIAGANNNTTANANIKFLFLRIKERIENKENLISFLDEMIKNAATDSARLSTTPFAQLPINALNANRKIKELTINFIDNTEKTNTLSTEIFALSTEMNQKLNNEDLVTTNESFGAVKLTLTIIFLGLIILSIALIIMNLLLSNLLSGFLNSLVYNFTRIAKGDFTRNTKEEYLTRQDEIGQLSRSTQIMIEKLRGTVATIRNAANNIAEGSNEISSSAEQIAQGAGEQASSTEEISASMSEMVSIIKKNSDNAKQTEILAVNSAADIENVVKSAQKSLLSIREIIEKIQIIGEIAERTDLLAINAAVEAARAGAHGKGFAVVAAEVRKLAERSQKAADEIDVFSKNSIQLTEEAAKLMESIVPNINQNAELVREISSASLEQNENANQINGSIHQLTQVMQENSASSEQLASGAEELASQAEMLKQAVAFFKVSEDELHSVNELFTLINRHNEEIKRLQSEIIEREGKDSYSSFNYETSQNTKNETFVEKKTTQHKPAENTTKREAGIKLDMRDDQDKDYTSY